MGHRVVFLSSRSRRDRGFDDLAAHIGWSHRQIAVDERLVPHSALAALVVVELDESRRGKDGEALNLDAAVLRWAEQARASEAGTLNPSCRK